MSETERAAKRATPWVRTGSLVILLVLAIGLGAAIAIVAIRAASGDGSLRVRSTPSVVTAVRDLARLETTSYHVERVIELSDRQRHVFGLVEAEDAILLVASGDIVAGVDLSELGEDDVSTDASTGALVLTLPRARILTTRLDNDHTYVHSRRTDLLARRRETLETEARREAERTLERAALESGILERAERNAGRTVESLIRSLGHERVTVRFE
ncbi:MAG: DUF4230 domain-containing protein [Sandaracinaceae bacterium]|nr:DUF4230 domain-containing protein [Sandaracinaceae bacterium]